MAKKKKKNNNKKNTAGAAPVEAKTEPVAADVVENSTEAEVPATENKAIENVQVLFINIFLLLFVFFKFLFNIIYMYAF